MQKITVVGTIMKLVCVTYEVRGEVDENDTEFRGVYYQLERKPIAELGETEYYCQDAMLYKLGNLCILLEGNSFIIRTL